VTYDALQREAERRHLTILGGFHPEPDDNVPADCRTLLMLGPNEPGFWPAFTAEPEWQDGAPDPMDRWSGRVIGQWAQQLDATPLFPFGGPSYLPFFFWAQRTGRLHVSPIMLLVHDTAGLLVSFRGALALPERIDLPAPAPSPCIRCGDQPCRDACPVDAFDGTGYDVPRCKSYLGTEAGDPCMTAGCAARLACPVSRSYPRLPVQSAYHMTIFKG
jgi:hypothetical protein